MGTNSQMLHFGKYKGLPISDVPSSYLWWVVTETDVLMSVEAAQLELDRRGSEEIERAHPVRGKQKEVSHSRGKNAARYRSKF